MFGEGLLLYFVMLWHRNRSRGASGQLGAWFLLHYGWIRFLLEFYREPDLHIGFVIAGLSMGQCLSVFMILFGSVWLVAVNRQQISQRLLITAK